MYETHQHPNINFQSSCLPTYVPSLCYPIHPRTYNVSFLLKIKSILWLVGVKKKYSSILRLSLVVCGGATTSYLRRIVPICNLNSKLARFMPAQLTQSAKSRRNRGKGRLLSWSNAEGEEIVFHVIGFIVPSTKVSEDCIESKDIPLRDNFPGLREDFRIMVLSPGLNSNFCHWRNIISIQSHGIRIMTFKWSRNNRIQTQNLLAHSIEIRQLQQCRDREPFIWIRERLNQLLTQFPLNIGLHCQLKRNVRGRGRRGIRPSEKDLGKNRDEMVLRNGFFGMSLSMFLELGANVAGVLGPLKASPSVPIFQRFTSVDGQTLGIFLPFLETLDGKDIDDGIHVRDLCGRRVVRDNGIDKSDDFMVRIALVDEMQVSSKRQVGNDVQCQHPERRVRIDGFVTIRLVFEPTVEIGQMVLHHFSHSQQILLGKDVYEILPGNGRGVTSAAIGDAKHELMAGELAVALVECRLDLLLSVDEFDVFNVRGHDKVWGHTNDGALSVSPWTGGDWGRLGSTIFELNFSDPLRFTSFHYIVQPRNRSRLRQKRSGDMLDGTQDKGIQQLYHPLSATSSPLRAIPNGEHKLQILQQSPLPPARVESTR